MTLKKKEGKEKKVGEKIESSAVTPTILAQKFYQIILAFNELFEGFHSMKIYNSGSNLQIKL